jgi:Neurotransmitter-gated ion-channel ligand binding domain
LLHYDGRLHWEPGGIFKTTCDIEIAYFPFDGQVCQLLIGAYSYHSTRMNITNASSAISTHDFRVNGEWQVVSTTAEWGITVLNTPGESKSTDQIRPQEINAQWQTAGNSSSSDMDDEMIDDQPQSSLANFTAGDIKQRRVFTEENILGHQRSGKNVLIIRDRCIYPVL